MDQLPDGEGFERIGAATAFPTTALGFRAAMVVHDSDGHAMQFTTVP